MTRHASYFLPDAALDEPSATLLAERLLDVLALTLPEHALERAITVVVTAGHVGHPWYCCYSWGFHSEDGASLELVDHHSACSGTALEPCSRVAT